MNDHKTFFKNISFYLFLVKIKTGRKCERKRDRETKDADTDWQRTAILTFS